MDNDRVQRRGGINGATTAAETEAIQRGMTSEDLGGELIPGILNDVTLKLITPKLSWKDCRVLSAVSYDWQQATRGHLIYNARVSSHSTGGFVRYVGCHLSSCGRTISLFCTREKGWYTVPPIPYLRGRIPHYCQCVELNGKLYVLGGEQDDDHHSGRAEMYVLDLAGQWQWKRCASMHKRRLMFGAAVMNGKIFAFGGISGGKLTARSEVYDPIVDAWSPIKPMPSSRYYHDVYTEGKEVFVLGGYFLDAAAGEDGVIDGKESSDDDDDEDDDNAEKQLIDENGTNDDDAIPKENIDDDAEKEVICPYEICDEERARASLDRLLHPGARQDPFNRARASLHRLLHPGARQDLFNRARASLDRLLHPGARQDLFNRARASLDRLLHPGARQDLFNRASDLSEKALLASFVEAYDAVDDQFDRLSDRSKKASFVEAYDPVEDKWRVVQDPTTPAGLEFDLAWPRARLEFNLAWPRIFLL